MIDPGKAERDARIRARQAPARAARIVEAAEEWHRVTRPSGKVARDGAPLGPTGDRLAVVTAELALRKAVES